MYISISTASNIAKLSEQEIRKYYKYMQDGGIREKCYQESFCQYKMTILDQSK